MSAGPRVTPRVNMFRSFSFLLAFLASCLSITGASSFHVRSSHHAQQIRQQTSGSSAHDSVCNKAMCIEANVEGDTARYVLRSTGDQQLGWMAMGFGRLMRDSAMVIMWPTRDEEGSYASVTLSQRKAPFETMPTLDPDPPFIATLELSETSVTGDNPQMAFTRPAPPDGMQHIIWAFSRTPPGSADEDSHISIHHRFGSSVLNLTRSTTAPVSEGDGDAPPLPSPVPSTGAGDAGEDEDNKVDSGVGNATRPRPTTDAASDVGSGSLSGGGGGLANFVHAGLCILAFLIVIPSGALVVRYAKATGSSAGFSLHRNLQFGVAGASGAGGMLAYLFMDGSNGSAAAHKWWGLALILLYGMQCAVGFWVQRIPASDRTGLHRTLLAGLGVIILLLAFYDAWLGFATAGDGPLLWCILFVAIPSLYLVGVVIIQRRFGSAALEDAKGDYVPLDSRGLNEVEGR